MPAPASETDPILRVAHAANRLFTRLFHDVTIVRNTPLPRHGPAIIVANHTSGLDPLMIQSIVNRPIAWMVAREFHDAASAGWLYRRQRSIPVDRNGRDTTALREALRRLAEGHVLGIFPEGRITTGGPPKLQTGVGLIAQRAGVPIYPVGIAGSTVGAAFGSVFSRRQRCRIAIDRPITAFVRPESVGSLNDAITRITDALIAALALAQTGGQALPPVENVPPISR